MGYSVETRGRDTPTMTTKTDLAKAYDEASHVMQAAATLLANADDAFQAAYEANDLLIAADAAWVAADAAWTAKAKAPAKRMSEGKMAAHWDSYWDTRFAAEDTP